MIEALRKPQYFFRPSQLVRRMLRAVRSPRAQEVVRLPWGLEIEVNTDDTLGSAIALQGVYDLVTSEVLWRLTATGDRTIDAGANVGYMTSILKFRAGLQAPLMAFEPDSDNFEMLRKNVSMWHLPDVILHNVALSNFRGKATLLDVPTHKQNTSWMHLAGWDHKAEALRPGSCVEVRRLDEFIQDYPIGVMKLDVEFHEAQVLEGVGAFLCNVRDIVFEENGAYPQRSHQILERAGFRIVWFEQRFSGPRMIDPTSQPKHNSFDTMPSYLATQDFDRVERLLAPSGWQCLR